MQPTIKLAWSADGSEIPELQTSDLPKPDHPNAKSEAIIILTI